MKLMDDDVVELRLCNLQRTDVQDGDTEDVSALIE